MVAISLPASQTQPNSSLGNDRKIRVRIPEVPASPDDESPNEYRFRLQKAARSVYGNYDSRLAGCCIRPLPTAAAVEVVRNPETNSAHFRGLEQCSRVWTCPVCAQRITNERRKELAFALAAAKKKGWTAILVTYTLRHSGQDFFAALLMALQAAVRDFKSGRAYQDIKREYGIQGGIKALETTYGEYGWHPHVHEIIFLDVPAANVNIHGLKKWLADRWLAMLDKQGRSATFEHGLDVRTADSDIAEYIAKWGHEPKEMSWGAESEVAGAPNKKAHRDGLTPFQILEAAGAGDISARLLFREYAQVMEGKRQLVWSPGLRALLEMPDDLPDEQLPLFDATPESYTIITISPEEWKRCCIYELQSKILSFAGIGAVTALREVLARREIRAQIHEPPAESVVEKEIRLEAGPGRVDASPTLSQPTLPGITTGVRYD